MLARLVAQFSALQGVMPLFVDAALKGAVLIAIAAFASFVLKKRSAAARHAAWTAAVIGQLAIPVLMLVLPAWRIPLLPAAGWMSESSVAAAEKSRAPTVEKSGAVIPGQSAAQATKPAESTPAVSAPSTKPQATAPATVAEPVARPSAAALIAMIWFVGAILVLLRLALGTWQVGRLAREGARVEDGVWLSLTQRLANRLGVSRPLTLLRGERLAVPVTWGIVYPAVLLPEDSNSWSEERRHFVLVHEMAHVKRFDALTQLIAQLAVALFWFDPLVWVAVHRMRVEREHACDDYVLRDGTTPSLYATELLEMVRSIGTTKHEHAAPAFAALAMARRSEFEGRMLAILDPRLDRHTLPRKGSLMTAVIVALLAFPLAALRPFQEPTPAAAVSDDLPASFKISILPADASGASKLQIVSAATPTTASQQAKAGTPTIGQSWSCDTYSLNRSGSSNHVEVHHNDHSDLIDFMTLGDHRCAEATVVGPVKFSADETRLAQLSPSGFARFREKTETIDRSVSAVPVGDGSISYTATVNGRPVPFDGQMQAWLAGFLPQVLREAAINVPERVARIRAQGGVDAVLKEISLIKSTGAKRMHYEALLKGPAMTEAESEKVAARVGGDLAASSGDLSAVLQMLPRSVLRSASTRQAIAGALSRISSSGDKASTLQVMAPNADPDLLVMLARAAQDLPSSGDKANYLITTAAEYLSPPNEALHSAYFHVAETIPSSGDLANVLISAIPYGHGSPSIAAHVVEISSSLASSGDAANVLIYLVSQRVLRPGTEKATLAAIRRTLTMASSGDRANVLISIANANLLTTAEIRDAFTKAALALPSEGDRGNVLTAAARGGESTR